MRVLKNFRKTAIMVALSIIMPGILSINLSGFFADSSIGPAIVCAAEKSGQVIKEIVQDVDNHMTRLEQDVVEIGQKNKKFEQKLEIMHEKFERSDDFMEKEKNKAEILETCAKLNSNDSNEIKNYKRTIGGIIPKLEKLQEEIKNVNNMGFENQEKFLSFRKKLGGMMQNSVRIIRSLRDTSDDTSINSELGAIEDTILGTYETFKSNENGARSYDSVVRKNIRQLETTYAQLNNVERLLEKERARLKAMNLNQISKLALIRLFEGRLDINNIADLPGQKIEQIKKRSQMNLASDSHEFETGDAGSSSSGESRARLDEIGKRNPFHY